MISTSSEMVSVSGDSSRDRYLVSTSVVAHSAAAAIGTSVIGVKPSVPTPETMIAPAKPSSAAISRGGGGALAEEQRRAER